MGSTPNGKDWCLKALHPSDPLTTVTGIPDESAIPTVFMNYQSTYTIATEDPNAPTWGFDFTLMPHPVQFAAYKTMNWALGAPSTRALLNTQLTGVDHATKFANFRSTATRWRLAYMSVTLQQDAPALADQGTVAACQTAFSPQCHTASLVDAAGFTIALRPMICFETSDTPAFDKCQSMPSAYYTKSKEGCYMPLKLTRTCQEWSSDKTTVLTLPQPQTWEVGTIGVPKVSYLTSWPFAGLRTVGIDDVTKTITGDVTSDLCNDGVGHICVTNLAQTTKFTAFIRAGYEIQVIPGSMLTPQQKLSPAHDEIALDNYYKISREMKDAYPADYNDLGKIWGVISSIAKSVSPFLSKAPGIPGLIGAALHVGSGLGDQIAGMLGKKGRPISGQVKRYANGTSSAADREGIQEAIKQGGKLRIVRSLPMEVPPKKTKNRKRNGRNGSGGGLNKPR